MKHTKKVTKTESRQRARAMLDALIQEIDEFITDQQHALRQQRAPNDGQLAKRYRVIIGRVQEVYPGGRAQMAQDAEVL